MATAFFVQQVAPAVFAVLTRFNNGYNTEVCTSRCAVKSAETGGGMQKRSAFVGVMAVLLLSVISQAQMQVYGAWHCGNDYCTWASVRNMTDFDTKNHWLIDRGDGSGL